jgi:hypothetical protein
MALLAFGTHESRRAQVAAMRLVATALETRPFAGSSSELVQMFAGLMGCAGCHGFEESLNFSDLLGETLPWSEVDEAIVMIEALLTDERDRTEVVNSGLLVAMFADSPDLDALLAARQIARSLGCDDTLIDNIVAIANESAATAKADLFRRFLSERIDVESETIREHMERHDLDAITRPSDIERYHQLITEAPEGSLGAEMRFFYSDAKFDIPGTPGVPLPVEFLGSHDIHHVLAGFNTSAQGEAYTAVFNAANASAGIGWLSVVLLQWHQGIKLGVFPEGHSHLDPAQMADAALRGSQTTTDVYDAHWDWMALLSLPLDEVRSSLGIPPGGQVSAGSSWNN